MSPSRETVVAAGRRYKAEEALERLQAILLDRVEGPAGPEVHAEYAALREALMDIDDYREKLPKLVTMNSDLRGVGTALRGESAQWEPRRLFVQQQMRAALEHALYGAADASAPSSRWTGIATRAERLAAARKLLPLVQASVEGLIAELERPQGNMGPPLEDRAEAIENLKGLRETLGAIIAQLESGRGGLKKAALDEAANYLTRAARALRNDPMPYLVSAGVAGLLSLLGAGALGGYLAGIALNIKKNSAATSG